jgi:hypothetical protein
MLFGAYAVEVDDQIVVPPGPFSMTLDAKCLIRLARIHTENSITCLYNSTCSGREDGKARLLAIRLIKAVYQYQ